MYIWKFSLKNVNYFVPGSMYYPLPQQFSDTGLSDSCTYIYNEQWLNHIDEWLDFKYLKGSILKVQIVEGHQISLEAHSTGGLERFINSHTSYSYCECFTHLITVRPLILDAPNPKT